MKKTVIVLSAALLSLAGSAQKPMPKAPPPPPKVEVPPPPPPLVSIEKFTPPAKEQVTGENPYNDFLKRNPTVKRLAWSKSPDDVRIYLKSGKQERYNLKNASDVKTVERKYGKLPPAPPPPPPVPVIES